MRLQQFLSTDLAYRLGWTLIHAVWEGAIVAVILWIVLATLRARSAQARYLASTGALALMLISAIGTFYCLGAFVQGPACGNSVTSVASPSDPLAVSEPPAPPLSRQEAIKSPLKVSTLIPVHSEPQATANQPTTPVVGDVRTLLSPMIAEWLEPFMPWVITIWALGVVVLSIWNLGGWIAAQRLKVLGIRPAGTEIAAMLDRLTRDLQMSQAVKVAQSLLAETPVVIGWLRPVILVPVSVLTGLSSAQLEAVLAHELAHIRRHDYLINLFQIAVETLLFYHPAVWWISRRIRLEREQCCDDVALTVCNDRCAYAGSLAALEEVRLNRSFAMAASGSGGAQLLARVRRVLGLGDDGGHRGARALTATLVLLAAVIAAAALNEKTPEAINEWAAEHGWSAQAVTPTTLESKWGSGWRNLPFTLAPQEEADVKACVKIAEVVSNISNGKPEFPKRAARTALEAILAHRPDYFYAEYLLSAWYRDNGDPTEAARLLEASYKDAPVVLVQQYTFADGSPLANTPVQSFAIECNRIQNGSLDPSIQLEFRNLKTDARGCIYLPVYHTVYRTNDMASPVGYNVIWPKLGWFESARKVGLLPVAIVTAQPGDFVASALPNDPPTAKVTLPDGNPIELLAASNYPDPKKQWWLPDGSPSPQEYPDAQPGANPWPAENSRRFVFKFDKALANDAHIQFRFSAPSSGQIHYATVRSRDLEMPYNLFTVFPTHPKRISIRLGLTSGPWKAQATFDPPAGKTIGSLPQGFIFRGVREDGANGFIELDLSHGVTDLETRVVAVDAENSESMASVTWFSREGSTTDDYFRYPHMSLAKVRNFRLESRQYQWAEFKNIALEPTVPATMPSGTAPRFDQGIWNKPLAGFARSHRPDAWFALMQSNPEVLFSAHLRMADVWIDPIKLGLPADAPIEAVAQRTPGGDLYVPDLEEIELIRGTMMAPLTIPPDPKVVDQVAFVNGLKAMTCEAIAEQVRIYHREHPEAKSWHLKDGEHYAILRADGALSAMGVHNAGTEMWVQLIPIGAVRADRLIPDLNHAPDVLGLVWHQLDGLGQIPWPRESAAFTINIAPTASVQEKVSALAAAIEQRLGTRVEISRRIENRPCIVLKGEARCGLGMAEAEPGVVAHHAVIVTSTPIVDEQLKKWSANLLRWGRMGRPKESGTYSDLDHGASFLLGAPFINSASEHGQFRGNDYFFELDDAVLDRKDPQYLPKLRQVLDNFKKQVGGDWRIEFRDVETFSLAAHRIEEGAAGASQKNVGGPASRAITATAPAMPMGLYIPCLQFRLEASPTDSVPVDTIIDPYSAKPIRVLTNIVLDERDVVGLSALPPQGGEATLLLDLTEAGQKNMT